MPAALVGEPRVYRGDVFVQQSIEAARPALRHTLAAEFGDQRSGVVKPKTPQRPAGQVYIDVNQTRWRACWRRQRTAGIERDKPRYRQPGLEEIAAVQKGPGCLEDRSVPVCSPRANAHPAHEPPPLPAFGQPLPLRGGYLFVG